MIHYLCSDERYGYGLDESSLDAAYILKMINMRYAMNLNSFQQYIDTTLASDVSDETAAAIMENKDILTGNRYYGRFSQKIYGCRVFCINHRLYRADFPGGV